MSNNDITPFEQLTEAIDSGEHDPDHHVMAQVNTAITKATRATIQEKKAVFKLWIHDAARIFDKEMGKIRDSVVTASGVPVFSGTAED